MPPEPAAPLATIAAALRRERERVGISLTELARRAGVAESTLSQLESGTGDVRAWRRSGLWAWHSACRSAGWWSRPTTAYGWSGQGTVLGCA